MLMNYKSDFFQTDPMIIYKVLSSEKTKVLRLDKDYSLDFEGHLSAVWNMLTANNSLAEVIDYFVTTCDLSTSEATNAVLEMVTVLESEGLGKIISKVEEK